MVFHVGHRALAALIAIVALVMALHQPIEAASNVCISNAAAQVSQTKSGPGSDAHLSAPCCSVMVIPSEGNFEQIFWDTSAGVAGGNSQDAADLPNPPSKPFRPPRLI